MRISLRRGAAVCLSVLALSSLSACGGQKTNTAGEAGKTASASAPATTATPSFPFKTGTVDAADFAARLKTAQQAMKTYHMVGTMKLTTGGNTMSVKFDGDADQSVRTSPKAHLTMDIMGKKAEMVTADSKVWVKADGKWVPGNDQQAQQVDQTQTLSRWGEAVKSAEYKGTDAVGHHFRVTLDPKKMTPDMDAATAAKIGDMPADYWTDDQMRPVKVSMTMAAEGSSISSTTVLSKIDQPVTIPAVG